MPDKTISESTPEALERTRKLVRERAERAGLDRSDPNVEAFIEQTVIIETNKNDWIIFLSRIVNANVNTEEK